MSNITIAKATDSREIYCHACEKRGQTFKLSVSPNGYQFTTVHFCEDCAIEAGSKLLGAVTEQRP